MDELLKPVATRTISKPRPEALGPSKDISKLTLKTPEDALGILQNQPDHVALRGVLKYLVTRGSDGSAFCIKVPGPTSTKIIHTLVHTIVPDYWATLQDSPQHEYERDALTSCLRSPSGLGAVLARLRALLVEARQLKAINDRRGTNQHIEDLLRLLRDGVLKGDDVARQVWLDTKSFVSIPAQRALLWKEYVSMISGGRVLSAAAQAEDILKKSDRPFRGAWLAIGSDFSQWIGRNVAMMVQREPQQDFDTLTAAAQLCGKAFSLGYTDAVVGELYDSLPLTNPELLSNLRLLVGRLHSHEQRQFLNSSLLFISRRYFADLSARKSSTSNGAKAISGSAALLAGVLADNEILEDHLVSWMNDPASPGGIETRRAAIAALSASEDRVEKVMERSMEQFGDVLFIKHTPIMQQEAVAQVLLLTSGRVHRTQPMLLFTLVRSSIHLNGISNRLAASSPRARFLGMVVGMALSELIDKPENRMEFDVEETDASEAKWYRELGHTNDKIGSINDLTQARPRLSTSKALQTAQSMGKKVKRPAEPRGPIVAAPKEPVTARPRIIEVLGGDEDDLVPYAKPDSDPEDDDDDPTLVRRDKPTAPVYIRDLLAGLRDTENYDRNLLALQSAADLIRRKSNFGTEVKDHIEELASTLVGLNDQFELDNFHEMRQEAMVAVLLAQPAEMGPWFARSFFEGEYSFSQRAAVLTTLGLGARELAGFKDDDLKPSFERPEPSFPSKKLPEKLHRLYSETPSVDHLSRRLERAMIQPMALEAADQLTGPRALKIRTFSSRMEVEKKRKRPIPNELAKVVSQSFFFPLTGRWWVHLQAHGTHPSRNIYMTPHLLPAYLKTLSLVLHASGPGTLSLPQMTSEFFDLLLSLRAPALEDVSVMEALLFSFLTLLETNEDKERLATEHAKELLETREWVRLVLEKTGAEAGDGEGERVKMLAAGVVVRCAEVVERYQRLLMGDLAGL